MDCSSLDEVFSEHTKQCDAALGSFKRDLQKVRTGRASSGLVEGLSVEYYGSKQQLGHLAQISTPDAKSIVIQPYDAGAISSIEKALQASALGFNPARDGNTIRVAIPQLTEDARREIVKLLHKMAEEIRISIRNHRRDANEMIKKLQKDSSITEDESKKAQDKVQKQTDRYIKDAEQLLTAKEAETLEV